MNTKITQEHRKRLSGNFRRMFFIQAFQSVKMVNIVVSLLYLARGLSLSQIFYLSMVWAFISIAFEVPSSYLADRWGRKKTIILGTVLYFVSCIVPIFAHSFFVFGIGNALYALGYACFTGTDDAVIYDTNRELGEHGASLRRLGKYYSAQRIFKIVSPLLGAFLARGLTDGQFVLLMSLDALFAVVSVFLALGLVEPKQHYAVEKVEAGVFKDAYHLIKNNYSLIRAIFNRSLAFIGVFLIWRFNQIFFTNLGISILILGAGWSFEHLVMFLINYYSSRLWPKRSAEMKINILNYLTIIFVVMFLAVWYLNFSPYLLLFIYFLFNFTETARWPIFSDLFNSYSKSFNRATTLSLSNIIKSILEIPMILLTGYLIVKNVAYPFYIMLFLLVIASFGFHLPKRVRVEKSV